MEKKEFNRPVAFIRVAKTASSTVIHNLRDMGIPRTDDPEICGNDELLVVSSWNVRKWYNSGFLDRFYTFVTVRNPYTRFISGWQYALKHKEINPKFTPVDILKRIKDGCGFNSFVRRHIVLQQHEHFIVDGDYIVDNLLRVENIDNELPRQMHTLGIPHFPKIRSNVNFGHGQTPAHYLLKYRRLEDLHREVFSVDWTLLPYSETVSP